MAKLNDLTGRKIGTITVRGRLGTAVEACYVKRILWECSCECGNLFAVKSRNIFRTEQPCVPCRYRKGATK